MPKMPYSLVWQHSLSRLYDDQKATALISSAQTYYDGYWSQYLAEANRANRITLKSRVLPGLSIYKATLGDNDNQQRVLVEMDALFRAAFFTKRMQGIRLLNYLSDPFSIVKPILKMMTKDEYLPGSQEIIEDSKDCFALNVYRCFILDTLEKHQAKELTALYCNSDDWLAEVLPKISWERTKTLGRGGDCCDFRWCRTKSPHEGISR
jgi:hypothetical protein